MLKIIILLITCLIFVGAFFFYINGPQELRNLFWDYLELDVIYLQEGKVISGWIWEERDDVIIGEMADKTIFSVGTDKCEKVLRDAFLGYLKQLI
jgi:hypothetical protein